MSYTIGTAGQVCANTLNQAITDSNLPTGFLAAVAGAVNAAMEEVRSVNPSIFAVPVEVLLNAPSTGTLTLDSDLLNFTAGTLVVPNAGCTVLLAGTTYHNAIAAKNSAKWTLRRVAELASGAQSGTLWHDAIVPADGTTYERILGQVMRDHQWEVTVLADKSELGRVRRRRDFGQATISNNVAPYPAAQVQACWLEQSATDPSVPPEGRLRFWPMPSAPQLISLTVVRRFTDFTTSDVTTGTKTIGLPGGQEYLLFEPILMKQWLRRGFFKPDAVQAQAVREDYAQALDRLAVYKPLLGAQPIRVG